MIKGTSNMLMQNGIMPYDTHAYIYGLQNPNMGYIPQGYAYGPQPYAMPVDTYAAPKKKHILPKVALVAGAIVGGIFAVKNPKKAKAAMDKTVEISKKGLEFIKEKGGKFLDDVKEGFIKLYNKIFKKG